jgi:acyl-CoA thioesterase II
VSGESSPAGMLGLEETGAHSYRAGNLADPAPVVFGGQILAQTVVAAARSAPGKELKSLHTVFVRGAAPDRPLELDVDVLQDGRTFATLNVSVRQGDRLCTRSLALLHAPEADLIRHAASPPAVPPPDQTPARPVSHPWWELRVVGDIDFNDPDQVGPPDVAVWSRFRDVPAGAAGPPEASASQALLAFASDGFLIATAMRPHKGVGQALAHRTISTTVTAQTLSFHEPFRADEWLLLAHNSPYAGRGRSYGRADVFTEDGRLVASYAQENMIRNFPEGQRPPPGSRAKT